MPIKHTKTDVIPDYTQADLDAEIALGNYPPGTLISQIVLPSDWNADHTNPDIADVTGLVSALAGKQDTLVSATNIKTINGSSVLGSGDLVVSGSGAAWGSITGTLSSQTDLQSALDGKVDENSAITGATKTKITYDAKGLVTAGADATTADIADSTNKRYVTDAQLTVIGNTSGTNTGDQTITLTGDVTGSGTGSFAATIANGVVTNAKMATVATATFKGRTTAGTGAPEDLTATEATALLDVFGSSAKGLAPASGGGTSNFLRADGTWAAPSGGASGEFGAELVTSGTTWTSPAGITTDTLFSFIVIGGGGGGAATAAVSNGKGSAGGAGCVGVLYITGITASTAYTIAIGAAGSAGVSTAGGNGGATSITIGANTYTSAGGGGGVVGTASGGAGGGSTGASFTYSITGQAGQSSGNNSAVTVGSKGGDSGLGFGQGGNGVALDATGYGAGGATTSGSGLNGGAGSPGAIFVQWWG